MIEITDEEMEFIRSLRKASDEDKEEIKEYLEENLSEDNWCGKIH